MVKKRTHILNDLRYHRRLWGYSLKNVAYLLDLASTSQIIRWEKGKERPSLDNLFKLAYLYRTPCENLYFDYRQSFIQSLQEREQNLKERLRNRYD